MSKMENLGIGFLRRSVGNPCRGVALRRSVGCPCHDEAILAPPRVRYDIALLRRSGALRRNIDTVHSKEIFEFLFRKSRIHTPIV